MGLNCLVEDNAAEPNKLFDDKVELLNMVFELGFTRVLELEFNRFDFSSADISQLDSKSGGDCCKACNDYFHGDDDNYKDYDDDVHGGYDISTLMVIPFKIRVAPNLLHPTNYEALNRLNLNESVIGMERLQ